jgi:predicted PurR-regulated permease PerM
MSGDLSPGYTPDRLIIPGMSGGAADNIANDSPKPSWTDVPWRTICGAVGVVAGACFIALTLLAVRRVLVWVAIAAFMAVILAPLVRSLERRLGDRRSLASGLVVFATLAIVVGVVALFVLPVRTQLTAIITDLPGTVTRAAQGKGPVGEIVKKLHLEQYVRDNEQQIRNAATRLSQTSFQRAQTVVNAGTAFITTTLLTFLFLSQAPAMGAAAQGLLPARRRVSAIKISRDAAAAVSGYVIANLIISLIAGSVAFICLLALGVPAPVVLALLVAVTDLIPLVGATIGAAVSVLAAYLHSPTAGIIALIFFIVYQQTENLVIYPWLMARKVKVNPVIVLLSVLLAVELFGLLGALLAIPVSGALQVVVKAVRRERPLEQLLLPDSVLEPLKGSRSGDG